MRVLTSFLTVGTVLLSASANAQQIDWQQVDAAFGRKPAVVSDDVHRYGFARTDLSVTLDGVTIKPALALGGWVAFKPMRGGAIAEKLALGLHAAIDKTASVTSQSTTGNKKQ